MGNENLIEYQIERQRVSDFLSRTEKIITPYIHLNKPNDIDGEPQQYCSKELWKRVKKFVTRISKRYFEIFEDSIDLPDINVDLGTIALHWDKQRYEILVNTGNEQFATFYGDTKNITPVSLKGEIDMESSDFALIVYYLENSV